MDPLPAQARWWHPVCAEPELGADPLALRLLGLELVLWRDGALALHAFDDRCPHRGARLSLGQVVGDRLQCAYHGWCFDGGGACVQVPALPGFVPPASSAARAWQVATAHGLVWLAQAPEQASPPALDGLPPRQVICGPYEVATSAPRLIENFLDTSHFAFVHAGFLGDAAQAAVPTYRVDTSTDGRPQVQRYRAWQPRASAASSDGAWVNYRYEVLAPAAALLHKAAEAGGTGDAYAVFACPLDEESTRLWFVQRTDDMVSPDAALQSFQDQIFGQDRPVLESQRPRRLPLDGSEQHSAADRLSAAYRRWLREVGARYGTIGG